MPEKKSVCLCVGWDGLFVKHVTCTILLELFKDAQIFQSNVCSEVLQTALCGRSGSIIC